MKVIEREKTARRVAEQTKVRRASAVGTGVWAPSRTTSSPSVQVRARAVTRPAPRTRGVDLSGIAAFAILAVTIYLVSTMSGYVMLESSRQSSRRAIERAAFARREAKAARESIEALTNPAALRDWAAAHGFLMDQSDASVPASRKVTRVALR